MDINGKILRQHGPTGSGRVREYLLGRGRRLFQITTFFPDKIGPGPTNLYLIEDEALILVDTGLPTDTAKNIFYYWRNQRIPPEVESLPADHPLAGQEAFVHVELLQLAGGLHRSHVDGGVHYFRNSDEKFEDVYERVQNIIDDVDTTILLRR